MRADIRKEEMALSLTGLCGDAALIRVKIVAESMVAANPMRTTIVVTQVLTSVGFTRCPQFPGCSLLQRLP